MNTMVLLCSLLFSAGAYQLFYSATSVRKTHELIKNKGINYVRVIWLLSSALTAALIYWVTGWILPAVGIGILVLILGLSLHRDKRDIIGTTEALISWVNLIRDTLKASAGINQALYMSASYTAPQIASEVDALVNEIRLGADCDDAFDSFASKLGCKSGDLLAVALSAAVKGKVVNVSELLSTLAAEMTLQLQNYRELKAVQAAAVSSVRTIVTVIIGFSLGMAIFAKQYMQPYQSIDGQIVLGIVSAIYGVGIFLLVKMTKLTQSERLIEL